MQIQEDHNINQQNSRGPQYKPKKLQEYQSTKPQNFKEKPQYKTKKIQEDHKTKPRKFKNTMQNHENSGILHYKP